MEFLQSADFWIGLVKIVWINIILSGDNAVVIALAARSLPPEQQKKAIMFGSGAAVVLRIVLTVVAAKLLELSDHAVYEATGQWVAGHSLKHLAAAGAAWPVLRALHSVTARGHAPAMVGGHNGAPCPRVACSPH